MTLLPARVRSILSKTFSNPTSQDRMALQDALKGADWNPNVAIDRLRATIRQQRKPKAKVSRRPAARVEMSDDESEGECRYSV